MAEIEEKSVPFSASTGINFRCPQCAGALRYSIEKGNMLCEQCGGEFDPAKLPDPSAAGQENECAEIETVEYRCPSCGASLHTTLTGTTSFCSFCGSDVILKERISKIQRPAKIIPFTMTREECEKMYFERISQSRFVPSDMKSTDAAAHFRPIYIPFWRLSGEGEGTGKGEYVTETVTGNYRCINTHEVALQEEINVYNIFYDACSQFDDETAQWLQFRRQDAVPFHPAYLSGFFAEAPDVDSGFLSGIAMDYAEQSVREVLRNETGNLSFTATLPENFKEHAELYLMPVWLLASRQGERVVYTAINGRKTDRIMRCDLPISPKRFILMTAALAALITALVLLLHSYIILRPQITAGLSCLVAALCWNAAGPFLNMVHRRSKDDDPTRNMLAGKKKKRLKYLEYIDPDLVNDSRYAVEPHWFLFPAIFFGGMVLYGLFSSNRLKAFNNLISDESLIPPLLGIASLVLLVVIFKRCKGMGTMNNITILAQMFICFLMLILRIANAAKPVFYAFSLISFAITLLVLIKAFRQHNIYVSRPSPFFENGEDDDQ